MAAHPPRELGVKQAWATTFYQRIWSDHGAQSPAIVRHLADLKLRQSRAVESGVARRAKPAAGLYESPFDLFQDPHPELQALVAFIRETLQVAVSHINSNIAPPEALEVHFPDSWYHITQDGGFHDAHTHSGCSWCGIYYLRLGEYSASGQEAPNGGSRFYSPLPTGGRYQDFGNAYLRDFSLDPPLSEGLLLLFPSYLLHSGLPYRGASDRAIIAFNARISLISQSV
jgi:uncharacterized protein (TIGR02466 family)